MLNMCSCELVLHMALLMCIMPSAHSIATLETPCVQAKGKHKLFLFDMWEDMGAKYGKVFKWFWATQPVITIRGGLGWETSANGSGWMTRHQCPGCNRVCKPPAGIHLNPLFTPSHAQHPHADPELARLICIKHFKAFPCRSMFYPPQAEVYNAVLSSGLTFAK